MRRGERRTGEGLHEQLEFDGEFAEPDSPGAATATPRPAPRSHGKVAIQHRFARPRPSAASLLGFAALVVVLIDVCVGVLPDEVAIGILTPLRALILIGLVGCAVSSLRRPDWATPLDGMAILLVLAAVPGARAAGDFAPWRWLVTYLLVYYLTVAVARRVPDLRRELGTLALGATAIAALAALAQAARQTPTGMCRSLLTGSTDCADPTTLVRVIGTFSNPNLLGAFLVVTLPFAVCAALAAVRTTARILAWSICAAGIAAVWFTFSRGPLVAVILSIATLFLLQRPTRARLRRGAAVLGVVAAVFAVVAVLAPKVVGVRWDVWKAALAQAVRHPLGVGLQRGGERIQEHIGHPDEAYTHAHNLWLNLWLETGVAGLLLAIGITIIVALMVLRLAREGADLAAPLGASLGGFAVVSMVDHPANSVRIAVLLAVLLGLVAAEYGAPRSLRATVIHPLDAVRPVAWTPRGSLLEDGAEDVQDGALALPSTPISKS